MVDYSITTPPYVEIVLTQVKMNIHGWMMQVHFCLTATKELTMMQTMKIRIKSLLVVYFGIN